MSLPRSATGGWRYLVDETERRVIAGEDARDVVDGIEALHGSPRGRAQLRSRLGIEAGALLGMAVAVLAELSKAGDGNFADVAGILETGEISDASLRVELL
ncbi:MAG: hypothetical protein ACRDWD_15555 [Acidimicrobiia bacterium]